MVCYCNKRRIIFIHVPKTGGLTIEKILIKNYGFKYFRFENGRYDFLNDEKGKEGFLKYILKYSLESKMYDLNSFTKFAFVRNPYTRAASALQFLSRTYGIQLPESKKLYSKMKELTYCYIHFYMSQAECLRDPDGILNIDYIGRFENFTEDLQDILFNKLGLPYSDITRFHENASSNVVFYDERYLKKEVKKHLSEDFLLFNYKM